MLECYKLTPAAPEAPTDYSSEAETTTEAKAMKTSDTSGLLATLRSRAMNPRLLIGLAVVVAILGAYGFEQWPYWELSRRAKQDWTQLLNGFEGKAATIQTLKVPTDKETFRAYTPLVYSKSEQKFFMPGLNWHVAERSFEEDLKSLAESVSKPIADFTIFEFASPEHKGNLSDWTGVITIKIRADSSHIDYFFGNRVFSAYIIDGNLIETKCYRSDW